MESSRLPLKTWVWAIHLEITSPNGVSSPQLHRALAVRQATAWSMLRRIRAGMVPLLAGGPANKMTVVGMKDRETGKVHAATMQRSPAPTWRSSAEHVGGGSAGRYLSV